MKPRVALFAGSFDPYTNGHHDIVKKSAALFDEVIVMIGVNVHKTRAFDAGAMRDAMRALYARERLDNVRVVIHAGLVADYCAENGVRYFVRGLRSGADYEYEEANARVNRRLNPGLETLYLRAEDDAVSSSMIRELMAFGKPVAEYVPEEILPVITGKRE